MNEQRKDRTVDDLERTVRALATEFNADKVFIVGSQSILMSWPDAPVILRTTPEIDAYGANAKLWEIAEREKAPESHPLASEHTNGLFGPGSQFEETHGFYIDGVDETTAKLPADWLSRAVICKIDAYGREVTAVAPCPEDIIVSKLARLSDKDKEFIEAYHAERPLDRALIEERVRATELQPETAGSAIAYIRTLP
jgi:hypothetical protein